jgi:hypothetical protein
MDGKLQLGYQAAIITMGSPTYGRLGLSACRHTGKTVSATQAEALALEAERRLGRRPWRRTDLLIWRLEQREAELLKRQQRLAEAEASLRKTEENLAEVNEKLSAIQDALQQVEADYAAQERPEMPHRHPLDLGYERFWQSPSDSCQPKQAFSGLLHFGSTQVTEDLPAWFDDYNSRQTIEAGNKEVRQVFQAHHIKVRSLPAMRLQEHFALFCANFVRFAALWLAEQCPQVPDGWKVSQAPKVKEQVKVGAHSPAYVQWYGKDCLVRFKERSLYVGRTFLVKRQIAIQLTLRI